MYALRHHCERGRASWLAGRKAQERRGSGAKSADEGQDQARGPAQSGAGLEEQGRRGRRVGAGLRSVAAGLRLDAACKGGEVRTENRTKYVGLSRA
jgi:hypothetical protein